MSALKFSRVETGHGCVQREQVICSTDSLELWDCSDFSLQSEWSANVCKWLKTLLKIVHGVISDFKRCDGENDGCTEVEWRRQKLSPIMKVFLC